jgi:hypothetical protein
VALSFPLFALTAEQGCCLSVTSLHFSRPFLDGVVFSSVGGLVVSLHDSRKCHPTGLIFVKEDLSRNLFSRLLQYS